MANTKRINKKTVFAVIGFLGILFLGIWSYFGIPQEQVPQADTPSYLVRIPYEGANPKNVEEMVSLQLEKMAGTLEHVTSCRTYSYEDRAVLELTYEAGTKRDDAYEELQGALMIQKESLPAACEEPEILELSQDAKPAVRISTAYEDGSISDVLDSGMLTELKNLSSVAEVRVYGAEENYIRILLQQDKMHQYGVEENQVLQAVASANEQTSLGTVSLGKQSLNVSAMMQCQSLQDLKNIPIMGENGNVIRIQDIAEVSWTVQASDELSRYEDADTISLEIYRKQSADPVQLKNQVEQIIEKYESMNLGARFYVRYEESEDIQRGIQSYVLLTGVLLLLLCAVFGVFFGNAKISLVMGSLEVLLLAVSVIFYRGYGGSIHYIFGMALCMLMCMLAGSVAEVFNFWKVNEEEPVSASWMMKKGISGTEKSRNSRLLLSLASLVLLWCTKGATGVLLRDLTVLWMFGMIMIWIEIKWILPLLVQMYGVAWKETPRISRILESITQWFVKGIGKILYYRKTAIFLMLLILFLGYEVVCQRMDLAIIPEAESSTLHMTVNFRAGLGEQEMDRKLQAIEEMLGDYRKVEGYHLTSSGSQADIYIELRQGFGMTTGEFQELLQEKMLNYTNVDTRIQCCSTTGVWDSKDSGQILIQGKSLEDLKEFADEFSVECASIPGLLSIVSTSDFVSTRVEVSFDPLKLAYYQLTSQEVISALQRNMNGQEVRKLEENGKEYSVVLEYQEEEKSSLEDLENCMLETQDGIEVPLSEVAKISYSESQDVILRKDGLYEAVLQVQWLEKDQKAVQEEISHKIKDAKLPASVVKLESVSEQTIHQESNRWVKVFGTVLLLILLWIFWSLRSWKKAVIAITGLLLSMTGGIFLLWFLDELVYVQTMAAGVLLLCSIAVCQVNRLERIGKREEEQILEEVLAESGKDQIPGMLLWIGILFLFLLCGYFKIAEAPAYFLGAAALWLGGWLMEFLMTGILQPVCYHWIYGEPLEKIEEEEAEEEEE